MSTNPVSDFVRDVQSGRRSLRNKEGKPIAGIDGASFEQLGKYFFRDKHRVYAQGEANRIDYFYVIDGADVASFRVLSRRYAKDAKRAYYVPEIVITSPSIAAFRIVPFRGQPDHSEFAVDDDHVYCRGRRLKDADPQSFTQLGQDYYYADKAQVWYEDRPIEGADRASFRVDDTGQVHEAAATDRFRSYSYGAPQPNSGERQKRRWRPFFEAHPELRDYWWFREQEITAAAAPRRDLGDGYSTDGRRIYMGDLSLDEVDPLTFRNLGNSFCCDKNGLYSFSNRMRGFLHGGKLAKGDPATLTALGFGYFRDKNNAYKEEWIGYIGMRYVKPFKADVATLVALSEGFAKDRNAVYCLATRKREIDAATAVALNSRYLRDKSAVFYMGNRVKAPIDPATCEAIHEQFVRDAQGHLLLQTRPVRRSVDAQSFTFLNAHFARDRRTAYVFHDELGLRELPEADRDTIEDIGDGKARDRHRRYDAAELIEKIRQASRDAAEEV